MPVFGTLGLTLLLSLRPAGAEAQVAFKVIVNAKLSGRSITKQTLSQIFLGRAGRWSDGRPVTPVDQSMASPIREAFSQEVLGMSVRGVQRHWTEIGFERQRPPRAKATDEEVIAFVAAESGGVGYVSEAASLPESVKPLVVQ
jgi:ABC-type phosphate transport system substrate-binding protein